MSGTVLNVGGLIGEVRSLLNDTVQTAGAAYRYSDADLLSMLNGAVREARTKRPDVFLGFGLRTVLPLFQETDITGATVWPFSADIYNACVYYVVGRAEMREDTFTNDSRAKTMMESFTAQLMSVTGT